MAGGTPQGPAPLVGGAPTLYGKGSSDDVPLAEALIHCVCRLSLVPPELAARLSEAFDGAKCITITVGGRGTPPLFLESSNLLAPGGAPLVFNLRSSGADRGLPACWAIANGRACFAPAREGG